MPTKYEAVVRRWYEELKDEFTYTIMRRYRTSKMSREDAEDIYQDIFVAIRDNLLKGRIADDTSWRSYIMTVGIRMAAKRYRKIGNTESYDVEPMSDDNTCARLRRIDDLLKSIPDEEPSLYEDAEVDAVLFDELSKLPEQNKMLLDWYYFRGKRDSEIPAVMPQYSSGSSVKVVRNRCVRQLAQRVRSSLYGHGLIDEVPKRGRRDDRPERNVRCVYR